MPKTGGSSAQSIVAPFLNYKQKEEPHQAFSAKICIMSLVTSCEVLYGKKTVALHAFFKKWKCVLSFR